MRIFNLVFYPVLIAGGLFVLISNIIMERYQLIIAAVILLIVGGIGLGKALTKSPDTKKNE